VEAIIRMDHRGRLVEFNAGAERLLGYLRADVIESPVADVLVPPRLRMQHQLGLSRYLNNGTGPILGKAIEVPALHADGREFLVKMTVNRVPESEPPVFEATLQEGAAHSP
jgi:PAS domain S-box-containing protein